MRFQSPSKTCTDSLLTHGDTAQFISNRNKRQWNHKNIVIKHEFVRWSRNGIIFASICYEWQSIYLLVINGWSAAQIQATYVYEDVNYVLFFYCLGFFLSLFRIRMYFTTSLYATVSIHSLHTQWTIIILPLKRFVQWIASATQYICIANGMYVFGWIVYCAQCSRLPMEMPLKHMENMLTHWRLSSYAIRTGWTWRSASRTHTKTYHTHTLCRSRSTFNFPTTTTIQFHSIANNVDSSYDTIQTQMFSVSHAWTMFYTLTLAHTFNVTHTNIGKCNENAATTTTTINGKRFRASSSFQWTIFRCCGFLLFPTLFNHSQRLLPTFQHVDWICSLLWAPPRIIRTYIPLRLWVCSSVYKCKGIWSNQNSSLLLPVRSSSFSLHRNIRTINRSMCIV